MTDHKATPEQWEHVHICAGMEHQIPWATADCLLELRDRVQLLEDAAQKHIVETSANILALASRVEALEAAQQQQLEPIDEEENNRRFHACMDLIRNATPEQIRAAAGLPERKAPKVYEISEPLKLTPEQAQRFRDLLAPNSKPTPNSSQIGSSLVEQVSTAIALEDEKHYWPSTEGDARDVVESDMARAAIREVAAWLIDRRRYDDWLAPFEELADLLQEEANR
jgi:hypothetical protein